MANDVDQHGGQGENRTGGHLKRWCRGAAHLAGGLLAGVAIVAGLLSWQLSKGPISLSFLTPYIEQALNERSPDMQVELGDTILTWAGWERALDIRVLDVLVYDNLGAIVAAIPEVSFSLSSRALIRRGAIVPKSAPTVRSRSTLATPGPTARVRLTARGWAAGCSTF